MSYSKKHIFLSIIFVANSIYSQVTSKGISLVDPDQPGKRWAILIGINDYVDTSIADLTKARDDAKGMSALLNKKGEFDYIFTMTDNLDFRDPLFPTKANIESKINAVIDEAQPNDMVLLFFSGHGTNDTNGNGYLLPVDTRIKEPNASAVQVEAIVEKLTKKNIKKSLLILDACRDVINKEEKSLGQAGLKEKKFDEAEISATFYSTKAGYVSYEEKDFANGVYTNFLLAGLKGEADANQDGIVTLSELDVYVQESVNDWAIRNHKQQKPFTKFYKEKFGDIGLAKAEKQPTPKKTEEKTEDDQITLTFSPTMKSAILPGWGQYSKGDTIKASLFFSGFILAGGFLYSSYTSHQDSLSNYNGGRNLTSMSLGLTSPNDAQSLAVLGYLKSNSARSSSENYSNQFSIGMGVLAFLYIYNIFDAYYFKSSDQKKEESSSFDWNLKSGREVSIESKSSSRYSLEFTWRF